MAMRAGKNLEPAIIDKQEYIQVELQDPLRDCNTYQILSKISGEEQIFKAIELITKSLSTNNIILPKKAITFHQEDSNYG